MATEEKPARNRFHGCVKRIINATGHAKDHESQAALKWINQSHLSSAHFCTGSVGDVVKSQLPQYLIDALHEHYDLGRFAPYFSPGAVIKKEERIRVFIPNKMTDKLLSDGVILEDFENSNRFYQYLNWTIRISTIAQCLRVLESSKQQGHSVLLIHGEIHDTLGRDLYCLCTTNDVLSHKTQKWYDIFHHILTQNAVTFPSEFD